MDNIITDEAQSETPLQTAEQIALTSHLKNVRLPETAEAADERGELPDVAKPKTLKAAYLQLAEAQKETDPRIRDHKKTQLADHIHRLGQKPAASVLSSDEYKSLTDSQNAAAEEMQITMLGRQYPVIKKTIDALRAENAALKQPITETKKP